MKHRVPGLLTVTVAALLAAASAMAQAPKGNLDRLGAGIAAELAAACPRAPSGSSAAYAACSKALRGMTDLPLAALVSWGGDQPDLRIVKKHLTNLQSEIFRALYLSLLWFDGTWSVSHDKRDDIDVVHVGAFFRSKLSPDEFPYPFWHSAAKWSGYEHANEIKFFVDPAGRIIAVTRGTGGNEAGRGETLAHQEHAAFDGNWLWTDADGEHPRVSLFSNKYSPGNPFLEPLDKAYRDFALKMRDGTCVRCHTPSNRADTDRLVVFQTPAHAAAAIGDVLKVVRNGDMPHDEWGGKKELDPRLRTALLTSGEAFSDVLVEARRWEIEHPRP